MATDYAQRSDAQLLRSSARQPEAFGALYKRHETKVLAYFQRRTACPESAADLTAETFATAFLKRRRYRDTGAPVEAWLFGIARRLLADSFRKQAIEGRARQRLGIERIALDDESLARIEELADLHQVSARLERAFDGIGPASIEALHLRIDEELPYSEVAQRLGCSEGAARVRVARALTKLADTLEVER